MPITVMSTLKEGLLPFQQKVIELFGIVLIKAVSLLLKTSKNTHQKHRGYP
jgi:hypothetical protein